MKLRSLSLVLLLTGSALTACSDPAPATTATAADVNADTAADASAADTGGAGDAAVADSAQADGAQADSAPLDSAAQDAVAGDASATDVVQADQSQADSGDTASPADAANPGDTATPGDTTGACPAPQPPGTVCQGTVWVCAAGYFKPYGVTDCLEATCANMEAAVNSAISAVVAVSQSCASGEECAVVPTSTACQGSCGVAVAADRANDVLKVVGWLDDNICKPFDFGQKCGYSTPKCMAPNPTCKAGVCAYSP